LATALDKAFENIDCMIAILCCQAKNRFYESTQRLIQPRRVLWGLLLFCASGAEAQSSNCADAKSANEVVIYQTPRLSSRDRQMTYLVMHLRKPLSARQQQVLDAEQHSWRHALASCGKDVDCIADRYDQRIHQLLTVKCLDANRCAQW
ncbi:MAG: hypothetical protein ABSF87_13030, partial [Xanthobacteraceae bacterium]|jgi:uncharacterized protein